MRFRVTVILASAAAALVVAGCGSGSAGGNKALSDGSSVARAPIASVTPVPGGSPSRTTPPSSAAGSAVPPIPAPGNPGTGHTYTFVPPPPKGARTPVPASQVTVRDLPPGASGRAWTADGGRTVGTTVEVKGCERASARVAGQSAQRVVMAVGIMKTQHRGQMCPMIISNVILTIHLDAPLGHRHLVLQGS